MKIKPLNLQQNEEVLLEKLHPDLYRIYSSIKSLLEFGDNGSIEIHFVKGRIKDRNGLYIKPGFTDKDIEKRIREIR